MSVMNVNNVYIYKLFVYSCSIKITYIFISYTKKEKRKKNALFNKTSLAFISYFINSIFSSSTTTSHIHRISILIFFYYVASTMCLYRPSSHCLLGIRSNALCCCIFTSISFISYVKYFTWR
jgi:hypothetical protein